jgi:hypothetical protein
MVTMCFRIDSPGEHFGRICEHQFWLRAVVSSYEAEGRATLSIICSALGLRDVTDTDMLLGKPLVAVSGGDGATYRPVSMSEAA